MTTSTALCLALAVAGCTSTPHPHPRSPDTSEALLTASAGDFHAHAPVHVTAFRHVRFGHLADNPGASHAIVCGELRAAEQPDTWIAFATVATSNFEQYIGAAAAQWCERTQTVWEPADLSPALQARLDRLR